MEYWHGPKILRVNRANSVQASETYVLKIELNRHTEEQILHFVTKDYAIYINESNYTE